MLSVEAARDRICSGAAVTEAEVVPLEHALGRVPADPRLVADHDVPPFANSSMDGYALRSDDLPGTLRVVGESAAGVEVPPTVGAGEAVRIMTGAPLPRGADAVVPLEEATEQGGTVTVAAAVPPGASVRAAGHDTRVGDVVELPLAPITPAVVAVLASLGEDRVAVRRRPRVAILSTGDELVSAGTALLPGQIHDANSPSLMAAVLETGGVPGPVDRVRDDRHEIEAAVERGSREADLLVASGGVSVGRHDHVRSVFEALGALDFWRINVQPGKPLAFGRIDGRPVIGLPGNPVSALVTFELFCRPLLRAMLGMEGDDRPRIPVRVVERIAKDRSRRAYLRVVVERTDRGYQARAAGGQQSSQLRPLAAANALLVVPQGQAAAEAGSEYEALLIGSVR